MALCPNERIRLDDGGHYEPSRLQQWLWSCWLDFWGWIAPQIADHEFWLVVNGDLGDGDHHGTGQIVSRNPEVQSYIVHRSLQEPLQLQPAHKFVVRGTEAHAGASASSEEAYARSLGAEQDPDTHTWSWWHLRIQPHGVLMDIQHHGRAGQRPWTEASIATYLAAQIWMEHARRNLPHPRLAIRSHTHRHADSYEAHPTRVIVTPSWQAKTAFVHKVAAESIADVGGILVLVQPDGTYEVRKKLYSPELPTPWTA